MADARPWGTVVGGAQVQLVTLRNSAGIEVAISSFGCVLQSVKLPTKAAAGVGGQVDVVLGYDTLAEYSEGGKANYNSIVGRCANRIPDGRFVLDGVTHILPANADATHLHGGADGLYSKVFEVEHLSATSHMASVTFCYRSPSGDAGYPGNLDVRFICRLNELNELTLEYEATTDSPTIVNLTNHGYWNLAGHDSGRSVMEHCLELHCASCECSLPLALCDADGDCDTQCAADTPTEGGEQGAPTGELRSVAGSAFDFRPAGAGAAGGTIGEKTAALVMKALSKDGTLVTSRGGLDHSFIIGGDDHQSPPERDPAILSAGGEGGALEVDQTVLRLAARLLDPVSRRAMTVRTNAPAIQVHTASEYYCTPPPVRYAYIYRYDMYTLCILQGGVSV